MWKKFEDKQLCSFSILQQKRIKYFIQNQPSKTVLFLQLRILAKYPFSMNLLRLLVLMHLQRQFCFFSLSDVSFETEVDIFTIQLNVSKGSIQLVRISFIVQYLLLIRFKGYIRI
ncbi:unnamed protein product [Paramecium sonneborni]|uniref:Uncharacterized protein n=1 Tax=Paramecium sonneborni TaxID=65129 RepID=A0A8S1R103_9CILI|nr:unnamed protein product [Paramecium sonneborni]